MISIRYNEKTGLVTLIGETESVVPVDGYGIVQVKDMPEFDRNTQHLYYKDGKFKAVDVDTNE